MKAVIFAGGMGSRIVEESALKPKPMIEIGGRPILWHILKMYSAHKINEFIICCGYKGEIIKNYFANYPLYVSDVTFDIAQNRMEVHQHTADPWKVTVVDTGLETMTGGRLKRVRKYLDSSEAFCLTYGDGVADINMEALVAFHRSQKTLATVTAVQPPGRFGALVLDGPKVLSFREKPEGNGWINGGFFVLSPEVLDYIEGDHTVWENEPLDRLAHEGKLAAYLHQGFWHPMDTLRDKNQLEALWNTGQAPWKMWK
jgi:glucose-1-phosphate cytidylyltransferase